MSEMDCVSCYYHRHPEDAPCTECRHYDEWVSENEYQLQSQLAAAKEEIERLKKELEETKKNRR